MSDQNNDPLNFVRNLWGQMGFSLPGMVTPTLDTEEIGKQIADLKAVEGWLKMNLSMLQMTIQNLEMQQATLNAVKAMGEMAKEAAQKGGADRQTAPGSVQDNLAQAAMWPWQIMQDMQAHLQAAAERTQAASLDAVAPAGSASSGAVDKTSPGKPAVRKPGPSRKSS